MKPYIIANTQYDIKNLSYHYVKRFIKAYLVLKSTKSLFYVVRNPLGFS